MNVAQPDIMLRLDLDGVIRQVSLSPGIADEGLESWLGRPWVETVGDPGGSKVLRMVEDARVSGVSAFRQVTQRFPSGRELPIEYMTVRLGGGDGLLAVGKSLQAVAEMQSRLVAAQQAMERDYWKLREVETRYRLLFDFSSEAVMVLNAATLRIVEANPAAIRALGIAPAGRELLPELGAKDRHSFEAMLARVKEHGRAPAVIVHLGREHEPWLVRATLMTAEQGRVYLLQLTPATAARNGPDAAVPVAALLDHLPDGLVVVDRDGVIRHANRAFLDLLQVSGAAAVLGERLRRWLGRPGADLNVLLAHLERNEAVRLFATTLHGELGTDTEVEISGAAVGEGDQRLVALVVRDVSQRLRDPGGVGRLGSVLGRLTTQIGKTSLPGLVRETVEVVERHYIEAALELTGGNRTAASEVLGLSRQSLYAKLNRYGLEGHTAGVDDSGP